MTAVAFIGLGRMGWPMAARIAGAFPLTVYNRSQCKAVEFATAHGCAVATTPREAAATADVVVTMLADEAALRAVCDGPDGVLAALRPGMTLIDMGTTGPDGVARLATDVGARGAQLVDAPVSGSVASAESGDLTLMVGGTDEGIATLRPLLETIGGRIYPLGTTGAGAVMKLAVNLVIFGLGQAVSEALVVAEAAGIEREQAYEVFENSAIGAPMVRYRHDAYVSPETTPAAFALTLTAKDLRLVIDLAERLGAEVPQSHTNLGVVEDAIAAGHADADMAAVAVYLRARRQAT